MALIGYARVSTEDQNCTIQIDALRAAGCDPIRSEAKSGTTTSGRTELETILSFIREGDTLVVTRIDRLARSVGDLERIVETLRERGAHFKALEQPVDTSTPHGVAFYQMLGVFAQMETALRRERQMEGIKAAKARGVYKGGKPRVDRDAIEKALEAGERPTALAKRLGIARASVYRVRDELAKGAQA